MTFNKTAFIFLACAVAFAIGVPPIGVPPTVVQPTAVPSQQNIHEEPAIENEKRIDFFSVLSDAFRMTLAEDKASVDDFAASIKAALKDTVVSKVDEVQSNLDLWTIPFRALNNMINNKMNPLLAFLGPIKVYMESAQKAAESSAETYSTYLDSAAKTAKVTFNAALALPHFGLNLMGETGQRINRALQEGYNNNAQLLHQVANQYKDAATATYSIANEFLDSTIYPRVIKISESSQNGQLKKNLDVIADGADKIKKFALGIAKKLDKSGLFFDEAGSKLQNLIKQYSLQIAEGSPSNFGIVFKQHVDETVDSLNKADSAVIDALDEMQALFNATNYHEVMLQEALEYAKNAFKDGNTDMYRLAQELTLATTKETMETLAKAVNQLSNTGWQLADSSLKLLGIIPEFGLGLLQQKGEELGQQFVNFAEQAKNNVTLTINNFVDSGYKIMDKAHSVSSTILKPHKS